MQTLQFFFFFLILIIGWENFTFLNQENSLNKRKSIGKTLFLHYFISLTNFIWHLENYFSFAFVFFINLANWRITTTNKGFSKSLPQTLVGGCFKGFTRRNRIYRLQVKNSIYSLHTLYEKIVTSFQSKQKKNGENLFHLIPSCSYNYNNNNYLSIYLFIYT